MSGGLRQFLADKIYPPARRSLENPSTSLLNAFGAEKLPSGVSVNEASALRLSAVFACIRVISETISTTSFKVYETLQGPGAGRREARDHYLWPVVHQRANREMSAQSLIEVFASHIAGWGVGFLNPEYNTDDEVIGLWPILPEGAMLKREGTGENRQKILTSPINGQPVEFRPAAEVAGARGDKRYVQVNLMGYDGMRGYSPIGKARRVVGYGLAMEEHGERFFGQGATIPYQVTTDSKLGKDGRRRVREAIEEVHQSFHGAWRTAVLDEGMKISELGVPNKDAQFLESGKFNVEQIARFFRMQLHKIQSMENATFSNIEMQAIEHVTETIRPYAVRIEQVFNYELFHADERGRFFVEFDLDSLMRGDSKARSEFYQKMFLIGALTPNQARQKENMNPIDHPAADETWVQMQMVPLSKAAGGPAAPEGKRQARASSPQGALHRQTIQRNFLELFKAAAQRYSKKEARALLRMLTRAFSSGIDWRAIIVEEFEKIADTTRGEVERELLPVLISFGGSIAGAFNSETGSPTDTLRAGQDQLAAELALGVARRHVNKSRREIMALVDRGEFEGLEAALRAMIEGWPESRPETSARRESVRAGGAFAKTAMVAAGFLTMRWYAVGENCPLCDSMDGRTVGVTESFVTPGDTVSGEGVSPLTVTRSITHPPLHDGCDCVIGVG